MEPEFIDKNTTCLVLGGISHDRLESLMRAGEIVPKMIGGRVVFPLAEVRRFARECPSWEPRRRR
ncbi:helix-turn-helix domain-containing protein [Mycobacterium simiae]|uniref:Helix-turn-helix domain-containing protein n=1 Tax=Mycobacterium simiae TaxID=1784 RepID=A0A5B1BLC3_MYCSI|nr:helix-turn-helix domain-containing protein [Mycobacterium simiae]